MQDLLFVINWWFVFLTIGLVFLPVTTSIFKNFFDRGYIFSKVIGMVFVSYAVFILGLSHIAPFTPLTTAGVIIISLGLNLFFFRNNVLKIIRKNWIIFLIEEIIFLLGIISWAFVRAHAPDIHGLEKFMDFGFINSILRSDYFPPRDMWFTPLPINYYYFGHLMTAVLTKISLIPSNITYNLMLATLFSFTFSLSFSIGANLIYFLLLKQAKDQKELKLKLKAVIIASGILTAFLVSLSGNLQVVYIFFKNFSSDNPLPFWRLVFSPLTFPNNYWYPNATRFIYNTIHEFPSYSFVVSDLHGHVLDIPIVLLLIAIFLSQFHKIKKIKVPILIFISFLLSVMYMTNVWDGFIYFLLTGLVVGFLGWQQKQVKKSLLLLVLVFIGSIIFSYPFNHFFKPFVSGIGIVCPPDFLVKIGKLGPFLFEAAHCQKSPWWQIMTLHGFFYFWIFSFVILLIGKIRVKDHYIKIKNIFSSDSFVLILIILSTLLVIIPEFAYLKDIYPAHYRANTMFKLTYQEFIMLSIASSYILVRFILSFKKNVKKNKLFIPYFLFAVILLALVFTYPFFSIGSYYNNLKINYGLDGTKYLKNLYPTDYDAIAWINNNIKGQPIILEAQGDSYTDFARISANTGLPTVLGWTVHEWLWRGTYDIPSPRIAEVKTLYETQDANIAKQLINKYKISYVFLGDLEHQQYPNLNEQKFQSLGKVIYQNGRTKIYKIN